MLSILGQGEEQTLAILLGCSLSVQFIVGICLCVTGHLKFDKKIPLKFHHGSPEALSSFSTLPSDISLVYSLAGIHLLGVIWPTIFCVAYAVKTNKKTESATRIWKNYVQSVVNTTNPYRWIEYVLCMPLAVMVCAINVGMNDFHALLSQMVLAAAIVVLAYGQEREKVVKNDRWLPLTSAVGFFICQWTLIFWCGIVSGAGLRDFAPAIVLVLGSMSAFGLQCFGSKHIIQIMRLGSINGLRPEQIELAFNLTCIVGKLALALTVALCIFFYP